MAEEIGIAISGLCSFLFWPYSLTSNDADSAQARPGAGRQDDPGRPRPGHREPAGRAGRRPHPLAQPTTSRCPTTSATAAPARPSAKLLPLAEKLGVYLNIENIFFNGYLMTPAEMNAFVDSFKSKHVRVHFDTGNIMLFQFPEHWMPHPGQRASRTSTSRSSPRRGPTTRWNRSARCWTARPTGRRCMEALDKVGYRGYLTFEYFHPFPHYPEALIYQTSDSLDRMLGKKV